MRNIESFIKPISNLFLLSILCFLTTCKKPYSPKVVTSNPNILVVEGVINAGSDSTIIKLSRTVTLSNANTASPEANANVSVESSQNQIYPLTQIKKGFYATPGLNLDTSLTYRLRITTADQQQYLSDFVPVKITPPIDSVGFQVDSNDVLVYINTHDPKNNTHYYRWDYTETWQFHSAYFSYFMTDGTKIVPRQQNVYYCFASDTGANGLVGSTAKLSQDVIYQNPVVTIPSTSEKIEIKYSIEIRQYALSAEGYNFFKNLEKNTLELGSIFDSQPSNINGNIHSVSVPSEPVIGFISACTTPKKRIFISKLQVNLAWVATDPFACIEQENFYDNPKTHADEVKQNLVPLNSTQIPIDEIPNSGGSTPAGFNSSTRICVDCRLRGFQTPPSYWQ